MKHLLTTFLLFIGLTSLAQPTYLDLTIQLDNYPAETSWEIIKTQDSTSVISSPNYSNVPPNTLVEQRIILGSGIDYSFIITDAFGDGICCGWGEGFFLSANNCEGVIFEDYEFDSNIVSYDFNLEPCELPIPGCMDESSNNYNPWATEDNGTCNVSECPEGEAFVSMELTLDNWPNETGFTLVDLAVGQFYEQVFPGQFNFGDQLATYTYDFCVSLGFELILTDTYGDGLNGSSSGGDADGSVVITACNDSVIWELEDIAFEEGGGNVAYSGAVFVDPCPVDPPVVGCMDDDYVDYNPDATEPGDCITLHTWGCTDPTAFNYNANATISDLNSPCVITITLEDDAGDGWGNSHVGVKQGDLQWIFTVGPEEFSQSWDLVLDSDEEVDVYYFEIGSPQQPPQETEFQTLQNAIIITNETGDTLMIEGDNPFFDNGQGALQSFNQPEWNVYHFTPYCGNTCEPYIYGCLDETAFNYVEEANTEDNSCYYNPGCTSPAFLEYHTQGFIADYDNGDCQVLAEFGCMDDTQFNYDPDATVQWNSATDSTDPCVPIVEGCMDPLALNFDPLANVNNFDCVDAIYGCTDPTAFNYNELANVDNDSCEAVVEGCTDPSAFNFNPEANTEDFSCEEIVYGCTDPQAANYDEEANTDNGSCESVYANCVDPVIETYNLLELGNGCFAWVIDVSPSCCNSGWTNGCQELYNYCDENTVTNIIEYGENEIVIFPNPTRDIITIASNLNVNATLYNVIGQPIYQNNNVNQIDMSGYEAGMYTLILTYNNLQFTKKIVKQ